MEFGCFPAGQENSDIMNALTGNNPGKLPVFPRNHPRIDAAAIFSTPGETRSSSTR